MRALVDPRSFTENCWIFVRDNSDPWYSHPSTADLLKYVDEHPQIIYKRNSLVYPMHANWNLVISDAVGADSSAIALVADRRMATKNIMWAFRETIRNRLDVHVCDHQSFWLSSSRIVQTRQYESFQLSIINNKWMFDQVYNCNFDNLTPRLYNCIVSASLLRKFVARYGNYTGPESPDNIFQYRLAFDNSCRVAITNIPIQVSLAPYASYTRSNTGLANATTRDTMHTAEHGSILSLDQSFIMPKILAHLRYFVPSNNLHLFYCKDQLFRQLYYELSCPNTPLQFTNMKVSLLNSLTNKENGFGRYITNEIAMKFKSIVESCTNVPATAQVQPLMHDTSPFSKSSYELVSGIEI